MPAKKSTPEPQESGLILPEDMEEEPAYVPPPPHPAPEPLLQFFTNAHLSAELRSVSDPFAVLAKHIVDTLPRNPERTTALRKLLEAKDCAVRAQIYS